MLYGVGTDIMEIGRMRDAVRKWGDRFLKRIFTESELSYCGLKRDPSSCLAARFAAKEAFIKAISSGEGPAPLFLQDIEILNHPSGKPFIRLRGKSAGTFPGADSLRIHLTMSHERNYAVATVILETKEKYRV